MHALRLVILVVHSSEALLSGDADRGVVLNVNSVELLDAGTQVLHRVLSVILKLSLMGKVAIERVDGEADRGGRDLAGQILGKRKVTQTQLIEVISEHEGWCVLVADSGTKKEAACEVHAGGCRKLEF